jgi:hypothetical protein
VKAPRFRIGWLMVAVAIAAINFGAIQGFLFGWDTGWLLVLGTLPMANVLAVGMVIGQKRPGSSPFLLGFEAFGAMALALYINLASCFPSEVQIPYLKPFLGLTEKIIGHNHPFVFIPILFFGSVVMLGWPQMAFALIGGFLFRKFGIAITRR